MEQISYMDRFHLIFIGFKHELNHLKYVIMFDLKLHILQ